MPAGEELQAVLSKHVTRDSLHRFQWLLWKHKKWFEENLGAYSSRLCSATIHGLQDYCIASPGRTGIFQSTHPLTFPSPASQGKGYETICFCSKITKANTSWDCCSTKCVSTMMDSRDGSMMNILSRSNLKTLGNNYVLTFYKHRCHDLRNELLSVGLGTGELLQKSWLEACNGSCLERCSLWDSSTFCPPIVERPIPRVWPPLSNFLRKASRWRLDSPGQSASNSFGSVMACMESTVQRTPTPFPKVTRATKYQGLSTDGIQEGSALTFSLISSGNTLTLGFDGSWTNN